MPTMAEQAGLTPVAPAPPASSAEPPIGPTLEGARNLPQLPVGVGERFKRGVLDIGQGLKQRAMQLNEWLYGPTANTDLTMTQYPDTWDAGPRKAVVTHIKGPSAAEYTAGVNRDLLDYDTRLKAQGGGISVPFLGQVDAPRLLGSAVATAPALALGPEGATAGARALAGALQGGVTGFAQFDPTNSAMSVARNTLLGAGSGAVLNPVVGYAGNKAAQGVSALRDRITGFDRPTPTVYDLNATVPHFQDLDIPQQTQVLQNAQQQVARTGNMDADSLAREANLRRNGLVVTQAMLTRNPGDWATERNLAKTLQQSPNPALKAQGDRLSTVFTQNDTALANGLRGMSDGLPAGTQEAFGNTAMNVINDIQRASQQQVGSLYRNIRDTVGDQIGASPNHILDAINELSTSPAADPIVEAAHRYMVKKGILTKAEDGSVQPNGTMTITQAEALRQHINSQPNSFGKAQLIGALDNDVLDTAGADAFGDARGAARARFEALDNPAVQRVLNAYGELQHGRTAQNFIQQHVIGAPVQDLSALVDTVRTYGTPEQFQTFTNALEAGTMKHLEDRAINPTTGQFSGTSLDRAMREIGPERLLTYMDPQRLESLGSLRRAAVDATVQPAHSAVNASNSGALVLGMGHSNLAGPGIRAFLPDIAHEVLPQAITNAPQNIAGRQAVDRVLAARTTPAGRPPNPIVLRLTKALGVGSGPALANQATQPKKTAP